MSLSNRRLHPRFPFHTEAQLFIHDQALLGRVIDISRRGLLFAADTPIAVRRHTLSSIKLFHAGQPHFLSALTTVAYQRAELLGLEILDLGDADQAVLEQIIDMNLGTRNLLNRDLPALLQAAEERAMHLRRGAGTGFQSHDTRNPDGYSPDSPA